ncbi:MAG: uracil phosphoribosyltransferase, partial [Pirellula sp.]
MPKIVELHHPLAKHHLAILRDQATEPVLFRNQIRLLSMLLAVRATEDLSLTPIEIQTPLTRMRAGKIAQRIAIIPILRAGLGL